MIGNSLYIKLPTYKLRNRSIEVIFFFLITESWLCVGLVLKYLFIGERQPRMNSFSSFSTRINAATE